MYRILAIAFCVTLIHASFIKEQASPTNYDCSYQEYKRPDIFTVRGTSSLSVEPTIGKIDFAIETKNMFAQHALEAANVIQSAAHSTLQSVDTSNAGIKITTTSFMLQPVTEYEYNQSTQKSYISFQGYRVYITQQIETGNLKIVGSLIDAAIKAGVTQINSISFDVKPEQKAELRDQMLKFAIKDATHKAEIALKGLNMKIHSIKSISLEDSYAPRPMYANSKAMAADSMMAGSAPTEIYAQEQNLSHSVSVGFIIVPIDE